MLGPASVRGVPARSEVSPVAPTLETARLLLRPWRIDDETAYAALLGDDEVMRYLGSGLRYRAKRSVAAAVATVSDLEARRAVHKLIAHWERLGFGEWAVEEKASGRLIGQVGLHHQRDWTEEPAKVEVGWLLVRDAWGKGYATEAGAASLRDGFERVGLDRVISIALVENRRSVRVMERIGLAFAGRTRWRRNDVVWYAIDRDEWERAQSRPASSSSAM
jgi:RimJ/RimL family protein N-acetyltransferase